MNHGAPAAAAAAAPDGDVAAWVALLDGLPGAAWLVALATQRVVAVNAAAAALFGRAAQVLVGESAPRLAGSPEDLAYWAAAESGEAGLLQSDTVVAAADGRVLHVSRSIRPLAAASAAAATHALVLLLDRSVERAAENDRDLLLGELRCTLEATADGILVTDLNGRVRAFNQRFAEMWAMPPALLQARDDAGVMDWMTRSVVDAKGYEHRLQALREAALVTACDRIELHSGQVLDRVTRPLFQGGSPRGRVYSFRDLTERMAAQERIEALAHTDALTGLANRARLAACVTDAAATVRREGGGFALLVVDLDRFRHINDSLGHATGDRVLIDVARRVQGCLRQGDTLARLGSDQFALLLGGADAAAAEATARRVLNVVAQPFSNDGAAFTLTCSIGMALAPSHGSSVD